MAGDWIKMRIDLSSDPAVITLAADLGLAEDHVVGKLHRLWSWANRHTKDGNASGVTRVWLDRYIGVTGFSAALEKVGWLTCSEEGICIPNFDRHNSESAKQRALTANRVRNARIVTKALPEKRREEKRRSKKKPPISPLDFSAVSFPPGMDTTEVRQAMLEWLAYKQKRREGYKDPAHQLSLTLKEFSSPKDFVAGVESSIGSNYAGLWPAKGKRGMATSAATIDLPGASS